MRFSSRSKAAALLLLVSLQYSFAAIDVALCNSGSLCFPKTSVSGKVKKACPEGYDLTRDAAGKEVCGRKVAVACPAGTELTAAGKCCGKLTSKKCLDPAGGACPAGTTSQRDCSMSGHPLIGGRRLLDTDNPLIKEVNVVGTTYIPNVILPKPAISFNIAPPPKREQPKINIPSFQIPQIILPEPPVTINVPKIPKIGPDVKFEGNPNFLPNIVPILPEPLITFEMPKGGFPSALPKFNTHLTQKVLNIDLSQVGPSHTVDVNLPAFPDLKQEALRLPDIDVNVPKGPAVVDLSGLGPKHQFDITLPEVKLPHQGSLTIVNNNANTPQYLDLTGFAPHNKSAINIKLPSIKTNGATVNVILDEPHNLTDIKVPGHGATHNTVINVPAPHETPIKKSSLVLDIKANPALQDHLSGASHRKTNFTKVSIKMPDIDLSKALPGHPDVVVDVKPLVHLPEGVLSTTRPATKTLTKIDVKIPDVEIPRLMQDKTIVVSHQPVEALTAFIPKGLADSVRANATETEINLPNNTLAVIPVPAGKTNVAVSLPLKLGLARNLSNPSEPDAVIDFQYKEEWSGGAPVLPNPTATVANAASAVVNAVTSVACPLRCCGEVEADTCKDQEFTLETKPVEIVCDKDLTYDAKTDACVGAGGAAAGADVCPVGMSKCSLGGKGVCVPDLDGKVGEAACAALKAVCAVPGIVAKSCQ